MKYPDDFINKVICGDCLEVMKYIPDGVIVITDPPYNIQFDKYNTYKDNLDYDDYVEMLCEFQRFRSVFIQYPEETIKYFSVSLGVPDKCMAWCYNSNISRQFRLINFYGVTPDLSKIKQPCKNPTDKRVNQEVKMYDWFSDIQLEKNVEKQHEHPCPVPVELIKRIIKLLPDNDAVILDPFLGSGTTAVACKQLGRRYIGIEINPDYRKIAEDRLRQEELFE